MKKKIALFFAFVFLALACLMLSIRAGRLASERVRELVYPAGGLSDSIFVSQNGSYQKSDYLSVTRELSGIPFYVDLPRGTSASIGHAVIVKASDDLFAFVSEHDPAIGIQEVILREFPKAVMSDYDEGFTYAEEKKGESGYLNGYEVRYSFSKLVIANKVGAVTCHFAAYDVVCPKEEVEENVTIAFVTTVQDSEHFSRCKAWLDAAIKTLRSDEKLEREITPAAKDAKGMETEGLLKSYESLVEEGDVDACFIPFTVTAEQENLCVRITAARSVPDSAVTLYSPEGRVLARAQEMESDATWILYGGEVLSGGGTFILKVTRYSEYEDLTIGYADAGGGE